MFFADRGNSRIRKINSSGTITTVAGTGASGYTGDGGPATSAQIREPEAMGMNGSGSIVFVHNSGSSNYDDRIRQIEGVATPFPTNQAPTAPTILFTSNDTAQIGQTNPDGITDTTPTFSAICNDPDAGDVLDMYRIQVDGDDDFSSVVWDSGAAGTAMANCTSGSRSADIIFSGTPLELDGALYYWRIKFWDDDNVEGNFSKTISTNTFRWPSAGIDPADTAVKFAAGRIGW